MRVMVTGHRGFIGSRVFQALLDRGDDVFGFDLKGGVDLGDRSFVFPAGRYDAVIHLASDCSTPASVRRPLDTFFNTVASAAAVLEEARLMSPKTIVVMTTSVKARDGQTPYGAAKRMVETWVREYRAAYGMKIIINRPGTVYGPGQEGSADSGWIAWFCRAKAEHRVVTIDGDG